MHDLDLELGHDSVGCIPFPFHSKEEDKLTADQIPLILLSKEGNGRVLFYPPCL